MPVGFHLSVPYTTNLSDPAQIHIQRKPSGATWNFHMIGFRGEPGSELTPAQAWRTIVQDETLPATAIEVPDLVEIEVLSFDDDEIVVQDTNLATQSDVVIYIQLTIFDTTTGQWWTGPDPQMINKKEPG